tara:strand:+ start:3114 stop:3773 length:660 start_codon:yes stop_codon:yes gene_type:complete
MVINLLQFFLIPRLTRNLIKFFVDGLNEKQLKQFAGELIDKLGPHLHEEIVKLVGADLIDKFGPDFIKTISDSIDTDLVAKEIQDTMLKSAMGYKGCDGKRKAKLDALMLKDMLGNSKIGKVLTMFPEMTKWIEKNPQYAETFILHILPRIQASQERRRVATLTRMDPPKGSDDELRAEVLKRIKHMNAMETSNTCNVLTKPTVGGPEDVIQTIGHPRC